MLRTPRATAPHACRRATQPFTCTCSAQRQRPAQQHQQPHSTHIERDPLHNQVPLNTAAAAACAAAGMDRCHSFECVWAWRRLGLLHRCPACAPPPSIPGCSHVRPPAVPTVLLLQPPAAHAALLALRPPPVGAVNPAVLQDLRRLNKEQRLYGVGQSPSVALKERLTVSTWQMIRPLFHPHLCSQARCCRAWPAVTYTPSIFHTACPIPTREPAAALPAASHIAGLTGAAAAHQHAHTNRAV